MPHAAAAAAAAAPARTGKQASGQAGEQAGKQAGQCQAAKPAKARVKACSRSCYGSKPSPTCGVAAAGRTRTPICKKKVIWVKSFFKNNNRKIATQIKE